MRAAFVLAVTLTGAPGVPGSLRASIDSMRQKVQQNQDLEDDQRKLLEARLAAVELALVRFKQAVAHSEERTRSMPPFVIAGTALVADDVTGIGAANDVLIPIVALAAVLDRLQNSPLPDQELQAAEGQLSEAIDAAVQAGQAVLMSQQMGAQARGLTRMLAQSLARLLGRNVAGFPGDHQGDGPKRDRPHWWTEVKTALKDINKHNLSPKQLYRELCKKKAFTPEQLAEIREALREAGKLMNESLPDFPPVALP